MNAHLPSDYVTREDLRLEAYRRLATVTTHQEVDDIKDEWLDRYGPLPPAAEALLDVGHLRAECARTGIREVAVARDVARMSPLVLRTAARIRLQRRAPKAVYKEDLQQLVLPIPRGANSAEYVATLLAELVPADVPVAVSAT
jgi:transcription-repair coupling factor (superfamily II helicase)